MAVHQAQGSSDVDASQAIFPQVRFLQHLAGPFSNQRLGKCPAWRKREIADAKLSLRVIESIPTVAAKVNDFIPD